MAIVKDLIVQGNSNLIGDVSVQTINGVTVGANPEFTDTTYKFTIGSTTKGDSTNGVDLGTLKSETAAANGTTLSLVTTGEKATWNAKTSNVGTVTGVTVGSGGTNYTPTNGIVTIPAYPTTLPANGGNSATVNNHSVNANVPSGAVFTDTTYTFAEGTTNGAFTVTPTNGTTQTVPIHGAISYTETTTGITNLDATLISTALRKTAQTLTAAEQAQVKANIGIPNIIMSTSEPTSSDGNDGDIWLVYES